MLNHSICRTGLLVNISIRAKCSFPHSTTFSRWIENEFKYNVAPIESYLRHILETKNKKTPLERILKVFLRCLASYQFGTAINTLASNSLPHNKLWQIQISDIFLPFPKMWERCGKFIWIVIFISFNVFFGY